jgi:hypothetical protein
MLADVWASPTIRRAWLGRSRRCGRRVPASVGMTDEPPRVFVHQSSSQVVFRKSSSLNLRSESFSRTGGFPFWDGVYCLVLGTPPSPCCVQNIENMRVILRLCARSLSLKELRAKSRQHGSYSVRRPGTESRFGTWRCTCGSDCQRTYYPTDNVAGYRLSYCPGPVNEKSRNTGPTFRCLSVRPFAGCHPRYR